MAYRKTVPFCLCTERGSHHAFGEICVRARIDRKPSGTQSANVLRPKPDITLCIAAVVCQRERLQHVVGWLDGVSVEHRPPGTEVEVNAAAALDPADTGLNWVALQSPDTGPKSWWFLAFVSASSASIRSDTAADTLDQYLKV